MAPGKTAPRLLQDLFTYDARHEERAGRNLLTAPPPHHDAKGPALATVPTRNCRHSLFTKTEQSLLPVAGEDATHDTTYKIASYCQKCHWHLDLVVDYRNHASKRRPCKKGDANYLLHHFLYQGEDTSNPTNGFVDSLRPRTYTFCCSAPQCPVTARISLQPPRLSAHDIETLTNQAQLRRRWEKAQQIAGDRADATMARRADAPDFLSTYLRDCLKPQQQQAKARVPLLNKKFLKAFGRDCDAILKSLGFEHKSEPEDDGTMAEVWYLPKPEPAKSPLESTLRNKIEDTRYELNTLLLGIPESERANCRHEPMYPTPSRGDMERILSCADYPKSQGRELSDTNHEEDHPYYAGLGAIGDFDDTLILFAFSRQVEVDIANKAYYFECLQDLANGRRSEMLGTQVAVLASQGFVSKRDLERAYQYFGIDPSHANVISDEHVIGSFRARLSDISPLQVDEARKQLRVLGDARNSDNIRAEAAGSIETYEQAIAYFETEHDTQDDFITTMYTLKIQENPACLETAQKALSIIAEKRQSERLRQYLKFGTMDEPEMDLGDAYAVYRVPDRSAAIDLDVLNTQLAICEPGEKPKFEKAYALIQQDQVQRFGSNPNNANLPDVRRNNFALDTWPVGLRNIGNTCYLNSVLQFLFTVKPLRDLILDCEKHMEDPSPEALKEKKVGRQAVTVERVLVAQKFVRELRTFYERMITVPNDTVQPAIDLAALALCRSDSPEEPLKSPKVDATEGQGLGSLDGMAISGPMLPPSNTTDTTTHSEEGVSNTMPPLSGDATPITPADSMENDDDDAKSDTSMKAIDGDKNDIPAAPTRPPPIPPRPQPQTTTQSKSKISIVEESARQQDAAEVMSNIFDLISCAIRGDGVLREGEQRDAIKKLFFSDVTTVLETGKGSEKLSELRDHLLVAPGQRNRSLYATLDDDFGQSEMEGGGGTRYDYIETAAPIQIINLRRIQFDRPKGQMVYDHSHIGLDTTMYLDRYLAKTPSLGEMQLLELRKAQWAKQQQLRELEAKRTRLQTTEIRDMNLSESLEESSNFIGELLTEKSDQPQLSQDTLPTPPPELADALHNRAKQLAEDLEGIDTLIAQLESEINTVFRDCHDVPYRLHAVFTHRGGVKGGHYWIYIYDFQNSTWRKYNDDMVDPVDESVVLDAETATAPKASTSVVYVRQDLADLYTEAVCRRPDHVGVEEAKSQDVEMHDANDEMPALEPAVPYHDVQIIEGVEKDSHSRAKPVGSPSARRLTPLKRPGMRMESPPKRCKDDWHGLIEDAMLNMVDLEVSD